MVKTSKPALKYVLIERELRRRIQHGLYTDRLPPERQLAAEFGATAVTARKALEALQREGLITRRVGDGTRVNLRAVSPIRIHLNGQTPFHAALQEHLCARFPEERLEFLTGDEEAVLGQCDLMVCASTFLHDYEHFFSPLPATLIQRLDRRTDLPSRYLDIHRCSGATYGVPFLVSATALEVNEPLAEEFRIPLNRPMGVALLRQLRERRLRRNSPRLFDPQFVSTIALPHLIAIQAAPEMATEEEWRPALERALDDFAALFAEANDNQDEAFVRGQALSRFVCRQTMALAAHQKPLSFPTRILPLFGGPQFPNYVCSESVMVARDSARRERLFQLVEAFLEPAVQRLVSQHGWGFPVVAEETPVGRQAYLPGDAVFAAGLEQCVYRYPQVLRTIRPVLWALATDVLAGRLASPRMRDDALAAYDAARLRWLSILRFADGHAHLSRLGAIA